ncbi:serine/threonine-protein kinase [Amycolatopsis sp. CA-230715]|uniref:serine/threonine-protein kinase n=1 Tax=Amycolatopsis sp. CA-230715 TaxID=2745196 RepID=UPI001C0228FA|nr:serine/threonine-protein kinase [Amycolatopsis sp. CA-230715]
MTVRAGALIAGRYRLDEQIGSGGMGVVWKATDSELDRVVAVKLAHSHHDDARLRRLQEEAKIAAGLSHPHIVTLFDLVLDESACWLVMEYVPSRNLGEVLDADGKLPADEVARIGSQLASALETVHARGIVHGDVAPSNVLIAENGTAKLTDFGISRAVWSDETVTDSGLVRGTPAYLPPEIATGGELSRASDMFSLGATLFAAAEGVSPLGADGNPLAFVHRSAGGQIAEPTVGGRLGGTLSRLLAVDPAARPTAAETVALLDGTAQSGPEDVDEPPPEGHGRKRFIAIGAAVVAAAVITTVVLVTQRESPPPTAAPPSAPQQPAPAASGVIGDPRTVDPCALTDAAALSRFGAAMVFGDAANFSRCDVMIQQEHNDVADVKIQLKNPSAPEPGPGQRIERRGGTTVIANPRSGDECERTLVLPDQYLVSVLVEQVRKTPVDVCAAADTATGSAVEAVSKGQLARRTNPPPPNSIAHADACALLDPPALVHVPGAEPRGDAGFGNWTCRWNTPDGYVEVKFDRHPPLSTEDGDRTQLAGHTVYLKPNGDGDTTCMAKIVHRTYTNAGGEQTTELAQLVVEGDSATTILCDRTKTLAAAVASKMPAT